MIKLLIDHETISVEQFTDIPFLYQELSLLYDALACDLEGKGDSTFDCIYLQNIKKELIRKTLDQPVFELDYVLSNKNSIRCEICLGKQNCNECGFLDEDEHKQNSYLDIYIKGNNCTIFNQIIDIDKLTKYLALILDRINIDNHIKISPKALRDFSSLSDDEKTNKILCMRKKLLNKV